MTSETLFAIEGYGPPDGGRSWLETTPDGMTLRLAAWQPLAGPCRGTVLLVNGRAEFIERYYETIGELLARGLAVLTFDWRGQGGSGRMSRNPRKGHVRRFRDYRRDLDTVIHRGLAPMPQPHFALAHSMGAALLLDAARDNALPVERLVALAPMIDLSMVARPRLARVAARLLNGLALGRSYIPGGGDTTISTKPFDGNRLTRDPARYARNAVLASSHPQLSIGDPTIRWLAEAFRFMDRLGNPATPLDIRLPTLVLAAGADPIVATPAVERFAARLKTGMALVLPGARHEILNETDDVRAAFWAAFDAFVPGEIGQPAAASAVEQGEHGLVHATVA